MNSRSLLIVVVVFAAGGCVRNHYLVEIRPEGESFERKLTVWSDQAKPESQSSSLAEAEVQRLKGIYAAHALEGDGKRHVFTGRFRERTPDDVGGAGELQHFTSSLGAFSVYLERFRGNDELADNLASRRAAADTLVDLLIGWFRIEVQDQALMADIHRFLDVDFRRDLTNLGVYGWSFEAFSSCQDKVGLEFGARGFQYLVERGYVRTSDVPDLVRIMSEEESQRALLFLKRVIARKIGVRDVDPIPGGLAFLDNSEQVKKSLGDYLRDTEFYQQRLADWQTRKRSTTGERDEPPEPLDTFVALWAEAVLEFRLQSTDAVEVQLYCGQEPFATNGQWSAEHQRVGWSKSLDERPVMPMLTYAVWSEPDRGTQIRHFGKVVLENDALAQYITWYQSLTPTETAQWDAFLSGLEPGPRLVETLEAFQFSSDPAVQQDTAGADQSTRAADTVRNLLLGKIKDES